MIAESATQFPWQIMVLGIGAAVLLIAAVGLRPIANYIDARRKRQVVGKCDLNYGFSWDKEK